MTQYEVLTWAQTLPPTEQLQLIRGLAANLPQAANGTPTIEAGQSYAVWSPHSSYDAAAALLTALDTAELSS